MIDPPILKNWSMSPVVEQSSITSTNAHRFRQPYVSSFPIHLPINGKYIKRFKSTSTSSWISPTDFILDEDASWEIRSTEKLNYPPRFTEEDLHNDRPLNVSRQVEIPASMKVLQHSFRGITHARTLNAGSREPWSCLWLLTKSHKGLSSHLPNWERKVFPNWYLITLHLEEW